MAPGRAEVEDFEQAFHRLLPRAVAVAFRLLGDRGDAEDAAVEALARACDAWRRVGRLPYRDSWVLRVTANVAIDIARRRPGAVALPNEIAQGDEDVAVTRLTVSQAVRALPRRQREVVLRRYFSDLTEADVAAALGISIGAVKTHASRAVSALRQSLAPGWKEEAVVEPR